MKNNNVLDQELFDNVEIDNIEGKSEDEIKKELKTKKRLKALKIALYAFMGEAATRLFYKPSDEKEKNTDYLDKY